MTVSSIKKILFNTIRNIAYFATSHLQELLRRRRRRRRRRR